MGTTKQYSKNIPDDILYHLEVMLIDLERLKLDYNRDTTIVFTSNNLIQKVLLVCQLYNDFDKPIFRALKNTINDMIRKDRNLRGIIVHIDNSRCTESAGKVQKFKISI